MIDWAVKTNQELAQDLQDAFVDMHARVENLPDGPQKTRAKRLLDVFHRAGQNFADHVADAGEIVPMGLTDKPT